MTDYVFFNLCRIVEGGLDSDRDKVVAYTEQLIKQFEEHGELEWVRRLENILTGNVRRVKLN